MKGIIRGRVLVVLVGSQAMVVAPEDVTEEEVMAAMVAEEELELWRGRARWN